MLYQECQKQAEVHFKIGFQSFLKHRFFVLSVDIGFDNSGNMIFNSWFFTMKLQNFHILRPQSLINGCESYSTRFNLQNRKQNHSNWAHTSDEMEI